MSRALPHRPLFRRAPRWLAALLLAVLAAGCADDPYSPPPPSTYYYPYGPYAYGWPGYDTSWDYGWDYGWYGAYGYDSFWCCGFAGYYGWPGGYYGWNGNHGWPGGPGRPPPGGWHHYPSPHYPVPVGHPGGSSHTAGVMHHAPPAHFGSSHGH